MLSDVSADAAFTYVTAAAFYKFIDDNPEKDRPVSGQIEWAVTEGPGAFSEQFTPLSGGYSVNQLNLTSHIAGEDQKIRFKARIVGRQSASSSSRWVYSGCLTIVPGNAAKISFSSTVPILAANGIAQTVVTATVTDQNDNKVDSRPALWLDDAIGGIVQADSLVTNGVCKATVQAGLLEDTQVIGLSVDNFYRTFNVDVSSIDVVLSSDRTQLDIFLSQQANLTATLKLENGDNVPDGTPVSWFTSNGTIAGSTVVSGGVATAVLSSAGGRIG